MARTKVEITRCDRCEDEIPTDVFHAIVRVESNMSEEIRTLDYCANCYDEIPAGGKVRKRRAKA